MEAFAPLDTIIPLFLNAGKNSSEHFGNVAAGFFVFSVWAAIAWAGIRIMAGTDSLEGGVVGATGWMLRLYVLGVIGAFLLPTIIPAMIEAAFDIGTGVSGGVMSAADFLMPTRLALVGWTEVEKLMKHAMSRVNGPMSFFANVPVLFYYLLASFVVLCSFVGMIIMVILSFIFFIMEGIGTLVSLGFLASDKMSWVGRGGPATLVSRFTQMIIMSASLSIGTTLFEAVRLTGEPTVAQAVVAAVVALLVAIVAFKSEQIGASIIGGVPGVHSTGFATAALGLGAGLLGAGSAAAVSLGRNALGGLGGIGGGSAPPTPPARDGGNPGGGGGGSGHGSNPFGPAGRTSAASQAGSGSLGSAPLSPDQAAASISAQARQLPRGTGDAGEAPTAQQWRDAGMMGTDITGMSRGQANAALEAHQKWYEGRGSRNDAAPPSGGVPAPLASDVVAPPPIFSPGSLAPGASGSSGMATSNRAPSSFSDRQYMIPENRLHSIGLGGGFANTGYHGQNWQGVSLRSTGTAAITGQSATRRAEMATARAVHFGTPSPRTASAA